MCSGKPISLKSEIELFKKTLNDLLDVKTTDNEKVLEISRKLDKLILEYYNRNFKLHVSL